MKMNLRYNIRLPRCARALKLGAAAILFAMVAAHSLPAATVTLQQGLNGYAGTADAWLDETASNQDDNNGGDTKLRIQYNSGLSDSTLIRFQLPALSFQSVSAATLWLYLYDTSSMVPGNALEIKPYRIVPGKSWDENIYTGQSGVGVNWKRRDAANTLDWTGQNAGWNDKADDGNGMRKIKPYGGIDPGRHRADQLGGLGRAAHRRPMVCRSGEQRLRPLHECAARVRQHRCGAVLLAQHTATCIARPWPSPIKARSSIGAATPAPCGTPPAVNWNVGGYRGAYGDGDHVTFADGASNPGDLRHRGRGLSRLGHDQQCRHHLQLLRGEHRRQRHIDESRQRQRHTLGANGYSGLTLVKTGVLVVAANNALGTTGSGTVVSNGAALGFQGGVNYASAEPLTISGGGGGGGALYAVSGNNTFAGAGHPGRRQHGRGLLPGWGWRSMALSAAASISPRPARARSPSAGAPPTPTAGPPSSMRERWRSSGFGYDSQQPGH